MNFNDFIGKLLDGVVDSKDGLIEIQKVLKKNIPAYDNLKVETQLFTDDDNFNLDLCVSNEGYDDGEIIFMDFRKEDK